MTTILGLDLETCSECPIAHGAVAYAQHPSTRVHVAVFGFSSGAGQTELIRWVPGERVPVRAVRHVNTGGLILAHNASFEAAMIEHFLAPDVGWPRVASHQWRDTMHLAAGLNLPRSLELLAKALGAPDLKDEEGHALMLRLSTPTHEPTPEELERLSLYCERDVLAMFSCFWRLPKPPLAEQLLMLVDRAINQRGVYVDIELVNRIKRMAKLRSRQLANGVLELTNDLASLTHVPALKGWLADQGIELPRVKRVRKSGSVEVTDSTDKEAVKLILARPDLPPMVQEVLTARIEAGRASSLAKLDKLTTMLGRDLRLRDALLFSEAHTGRWSSRGVQLHNLVKPSKKFKAVSDQFTAAVRAGDINAASAIWPVLDGLSFLLRSVFRAAPGHEFIGADYSAIEARVLAWLAGEQHVLDAFTAGRDIYVEDAAAYGSTNRDFGKLLRLSLGYGMGAVKLAGKAAKEGLALSLKEARNAQQGWRKGNPNIVSWWYALQDAFAEAIEHPGVEHAVGRVVFIASKQLLRIILPSGRALHYWRPHRERVTKRMEIVNDAGELERRDVELMECRYYSAKRKDMERESTYGGSLAENITQAVARDILAAALQRLEGSAYPVVLHVHDSIVAEVPTGTGDVTEFCELLTIRPPWGLGLPMAAEGYRRGHFLG